MAGFEVTTYGRFCGDHRGYGHDLENWALFEPFKINPYDAPIIVRPDDVDLQEACKLLGLKIERP
jgi:hypothetical protein